MSDDNAQETQDKTPVEEGTGTEVQEVKEQAAVEPPGEVNLEEAWDEARAKAAFSKKNNENKNLRDRLKAAEEAAAKWAEHERSQMDDRQRLESDLKERDARYAALVRERNTLAIQKAYPVLGDDLIDLLPLDADFEALEAKAKTLADRIAKAAKPEQERTVVETNELLNADTDGDSGDFDPRKLAAKYASRR